MLCEDLGVEQSLASSVITSVSVHLLLFSICNSQFQDPTCILLPPRSREAISQGLLNQIVAALATRYDTTMATIRRHFRADQVEEWGKVRRLNEGDTMNASSMFRPAEDRRDATYVRVGYFQS